MATTESRGGIAALMVAHCAGMLDLVSLPLWVGTLISQYRFDPQQAGGLATLFLVGASLASVVFAPRFTRHVPRRMVAGTALSFPVTGRMTTVDAANAAGTRLPALGRAVAGTPAMLMVGSAIAPFLGGTLVKYIGFEAIGYATAFLVACELMLFNATRTLVGRREAA